MYCTNTMKIKMNNNIKAIKAMDIVLTFHKKFVDFFINFISIINFRKSNLTRRCWYDNAMTKTYGNSRNGIQRQINTFPPKRFAVNSHVSYANISSRTKKYKCKENDGNKNTSYKPVTKSSPCVIAEVHRFAINHI